MCWRLLRNNLKIFTSFSRYESSNSPSDSWSTVFRVHSNGGASASSREILSLTQFQKGLSQLFRLTPFMEPPSSRQAETLFVEAGGRRGLLSFEKFVRWVESCRVYFFIFWNVLNSLPFKILYNISCLRSYTLSASSSFSSFFCPCTQNNRYFEDPRREAGGMSSGGSRSPGTISSTSRQRSESGMSGTWLSLCYLLFC